MLTPLHIAPYTIIDSCYDQPYINGHINIGQDYNAEVNGQDTVVRVLISDRCVMDLWQMLLSMSVAY